MMSVRNAICAKLTDMDTKRCTACELDLPFDSFHKHKMGKYGLESKCKDCRHKKRAANYDATREKCTEAKREWREANREKSHDYLKAYYTSNAERINITRRLRTYGLTIERYEEMLAEQDGMCGLCEGEMPSPYVDHDHTCCPSKKKACGKCVRMLLCINCNLALGHFKDNPKLLRKAAEYIELFQLDTGRVFND